MPDERPRIALGPKQFRLRSMFLLMTVVAVACASLAPFPTVVTPKIVVTVVDTTAAPIGQCSLERSWSGVWGYHDDENSFTDNQGVCELPERTVSHSLLARIGILLGCLLPHQGGWGETITDVSVDINDSWEFDQIVATGPGSNRTYSWLGNFQNKRTMTFRVFGTSGERSCRVVFRRPSGQ